MSEKFNLGRSKLISSYGGVGSLVDTQNASVVIETFDNWEYPYYEELDENLIIHDDRFLERLKVRFPKLKCLVSIPIIENGYKSSGRVRIKANYFPKWFYCPNCKRFMSLGQWNKRNKDKTKYLQCFNPECKNERLEQVRFVMTCPDGHIHDVPWEYWNNRDSNIEEHDEENIVKFRYERCCEEQELYYKISNENTDLSGIHIECKKCGKSATLKGIFNYNQNCYGYKYWLGLKEGKFIKDHCDKKAEVKIKTSNSIYYANNLNSIWIPVKQKLSLTNEMRNEIDKIISDEDFVPSDLKKYARRNNIDIELVNDYVNQGLKANYLTENIYRQAEYDYFLDNNEKEDIDIRFTHVKEEILGFEKIVRIDKLKKVSVQTSFTRNEPIDKDSVLINDDRYGYKVKRQSISKYNYETYCLPAVENYGEGVLFVLDNNKLTEWEKNIDVAKRTNVIKDNAEKSDWQIYKIESENITARKILIHTISHLLIKEFEYICGYSMSSMQERLYVSEKMNGFLITAFDGTDGFLGGLSKLCNNIEKLNTIIISALRRAQNCSLDPICYETEGQGVSNLNLSACHSCSLIPENSCELNNLFLDRRLVVDLDYGYFKDLLK